MINSVAYFPFYCAQNSSPVITAVLDFLRSQKIQIKENSLDSDAVIIWSVLWHGRMAPNKQVYEHYQSQNKPIICIDVGALIRNVTWKISLNNITAQGYYGHLTDLDFDRPKKLGLSIGKLINPSHKILITAQHSKSLQVCRLPSMEEWINQQIDLVSNYTDRPVVVRPHPRSRLDVSKINKSVQVQSPTHLKSTYDSFDLDLNYHMIINYNSGVGIQAALSGAQIIVDNSSLAYPVTSQIEKIDLDQPMDRSHWLIQVAHTEYLLEEIRQGIWFNRLHLNDFTKNY